MALKTLTSTGISNGNPILPGQVTQSVDAFTGAEGYAITISGSFTLTGATTGSGVFNEAISSSQAETSVNASKLNPSLNNTINQNYNVLFASTSSATYEQIFREDGAVMIYNPSTDLLTVTSSYAVSSSRAISSSYSDNAAVSQVNAQQYDNGISVVPANFKFIAGKVAMLNGAATSSIFSVLIGKSLGDDVFINASYPTTFTPFTSSVTVDTTPGPPYTTNLSILKVNVSSSGEVLITGGPNDTGTIIFTGIYI
jgi:hypothetical protein